MTKRFTYQVYYGDGVYDEQFHYTSDDINEINFLTHFLKTYDYDLSYNINLLEHEADIKRMGELANVILANREKNLIDINKNLEDVLNSAKNVFFRIFDICPYDEYDNEATPDGYKIDDITNCTILTVKEAEQLINTKLNMNVKIYGDDLLY